MSVASVPSWQLEQLNQLAGAGALYGVPPDILASIDQAESSGSGGGINSSGYGGYFGLGVGAAYPEGPGGASTAPVSASLLQGTDPTAFDTQAQIAAGEFASLLAANGGNPYLAEAAYQIGPNAGAAALASYAQTGEGPGVFAANGIPGGVPTAVLTSSSQGGLGGAVTSALGAANPALGAAANLVTGGFSGLSNSILSISLTVVFTLAGLGLIALGLARIFPGVTTTVTRAAPLLAA